MATKRKVGFAEQEDEDLEKAYAEATAEVKRQTGAVETDKNRRFKEKHSLDSDEEDVDEDKYNVLDEEAIEGQEDGGVNYEEGIQFTPFNMREELEEGHFDQQGMYIFNKEKDIRDNWLDNINWVKVKEVENNKDKYGSDYESSDEENVELHKQKIDQTDIYKKMVELMKPGESVLKAIKRLGGGKAGLSSASASQRWKTKKQKTSSNTVTSSAESGENKEHMLQLTGFADELLSVGNLEIYQDTYEKLNFKIKLAEEKIENAKTRIPEGTNEDDALDMFADDIDKKADDGNSKENGASTSNKPAKSTETEVKWEYKWDEKEDAEIHGPFCSTDMMEWAESGYFKQGVQCRRVGTEQFYNSKRIDFELYT